MSCARENLQTLEPLRARMGVWSTLWRIPCLDERVGLRTSSRLRRALGLYRPARTEITLAAWLLEEPGPLLDEVLCHEAAHAAVHLSHGSRVRPHGREWRGLMADAGYAPRIRIPEALIPESRRIERSPARFWEHRCPVCRATRLAKKRVLQWRCGRCRDQGREGRLVVERREERAGWSGFG